MDPFLLLTFHVYLCYVVPCDWKRADLFALLCLCFLLCFVAFPFSVPGQVWYCMILTPDLCPFLYF